MNPQVYALRVASVLFGIMALGQVLRLFTQAEMVLASIPVPLWGSALGALVTGALSFWFWRVSCASVSK